VGGGGVRLRSESFLRHYGSVSSAEPSRQLTRDAAHPELTELEELPATRTRANRSVWVRDQTECRALLDTVNAVSRAATSCTRDGQSSVFSKAIVRGH
jgi:hypothetical protein